MEVSSNDTDLSKFDDALLEISRYATFQTLIKLRFVNVSWRKTIEGLDLWTSLIFRSLEIKPWVNQLFGMYHPDLSCNSYKNLPNYVYARLYVSFMSWKRLGVPKSFELDYIDRPVDSRENWIASDSFANYLACVSRTKELSIFDINTLQLFAGPINISEHLSEEENLGLNDIWLKIWLPGAPSASAELNSLKTQKFFVIVTGLYFTFIWDVERLKRVSSPKVIKELSIEPIYFAKRVHRGCASDIFIEFVDDWHGTKVKFVRFIWDSKRQKITAQIVLVLKNIRPDEMRSYELRDFYAENTQIMLLFKYSGKLYITQVDVPKKIEDFVEFGIDDEEHCKLVFENADEEFISTAKIHNSDVIIGHNGYSFRVMVREKSTNHEGYKLNEYYLLCRQKFSSIVAVEYKFNNLFIFDATGSSGVYKLENAGSFQRINFNTDRVTEIKNKKFFMDPNIKLVLKNGAPCLALVSTRIILFAKL